MTADLYFGPTHQPVGFANPALAQFDGSAEPVVRELLQNSMDAIHAARHGRGEVRFVIREVPLSQIPGMESYKKAFEAAKKQRHDWHGGHPTPHEKRAVALIDNALKPRTVPVLFCVDNGQGLDPRRMSALLAAGSGDKAEEGAGSFGLGHYAAFGASSLRYALYASRYRDGAEPRTITSGHAILATHRGDSDNPDSLSAADGYWFKAGRREFPLDPGPDSFPTEIRYLFTPFLNRLVGTGTAVAILGFNDFHRDAEDATAVEAISRVVASNFAYAIHAETLVVEVLDERDGSSEKVTPQRLGPILERYSQQRRARKRGQIRGSTAFSAWRTMSQGDRIPIDGGAIYWRRVEDPEERRGGSNTVHVFRRGMWITSNAPLLDRPMFADSRPFDAVLGLNGGQLEQLVRASEGPEHRGVDRKRLSPAQKRDYKYAVDEIAERLRQAVGERDADEEFTPPGFATLAGREFRKAERLRPPRLPGGGGVSRASVPGGSESTKSPRRRERYAGTPRRGTAPRYRATMRPSAGAVGAVIEVQVDYQEEAAQGSKMGVRLRSASGADATCETPVRDTFLRILSISDGDGGRAYSGSPSGTLEVEVPAKRGIRQLTVRLAEQPSDPQLLVLDLVKRLSDRDERPRARSG